jgi:GNAT superfamily N-acetyltransferase
MSRPPAIRRAVPADVEAVTALLRELGYPVEAPGVEPTLRALVDDPRAFVLVAVDDALGVVGLVSLSARPVLRLGGAVGTIEELVVRRGARGRGVGTQLLQYAKGLAAERGWVRLEVSVTRLREVNRGEFFAGRGLSPVDSVTYRWGRLEGRHPLLPVIGGVPRRHELLV